MMILIAYVLCLLMVHIKSLGGFLTMWVLATFGSLGQCRSTVALLVTVGLSATLMWVASVAMGGGRR